MKRFIAAAALAVIFGFGSAFAADLAGGMNATLSDFTSDMASDVGGGAKIDIKATDSGFTIEIQDVKTTPEGDTKGKGLLVPQQLRMASGIMDAHSNKKERYFVDVPVDNGTAIVANIPNFAKQQKHAVVEHNWGISCADGTLHCSDKEVRHLVLDPNDPWVAYPTSESSTWVALNGDKVDLQHLVIGWIMCPNGQALPLKSAGKGKLAQGVRPELDDFCAKSAVREQFSRYK